MQALAVRVAFWAPGWRVRGTTLAKVGGLEAALAAMTAPLIYPFFMAEGWFTRTNLPRRLAAAGQGELRRLAPFGTDPGLPDVVAAALRRGGGNEHATGGVLIAAHGGKLSKTSSETGYLMVEELARRGFGPLRAGFVEEPPFLEDVAREMGRGICLPFFALRAGHVVQDVPEALAAAGFQGVLLPPIGEDQGVAPLIAAALERAHQGG